MDKLEEVYRACVLKGNRHMKCLCGEKLYEYRACRDGHYEKEQPGVELAHMFNWMTSFVTGLAPLLYRTEKKTEYLIWANSWKKAYHDKIFLTPLHTMHDIGFLYSSYSVAMYQLTGEEGHKQDALKAADELLKRFDIKGKYIDAWGRMDDDGRTGRAIVDCVMNIQLLLWAWKETGHTLYRDVAKTHADTTIRYFVREDFSVCHSFDFDRETGKVIRENNGCGYANGTHWARGTAWMIYGLAMTARYLQDADYYEVAGKVLEKYQENLKGSYVPVWDFRLPENMPAFECGHADDPQWDVREPLNCRYNIDTSAAAIVTCAMIEMDRFSKDNRYRKTIRATLEELCEKYFNTDTDTPGMLSHQNGQMVYTVYGDYFFVQALQQVLYDTESCW